MNTFQSDAVISSSHALSSCRSRSLAHSSSRFNLPEFTRRRRPPVNFLRKTRPSSTLSVRYGFSRFSAADADLCPVPVDVGHAQVGGFPQPQTGRVAGQVEGTPRDFLFVDQIQLVLVNLFRPQLAGRFAEELAELVDVIRIGVDGGVRQVSQLHIADHTLDEGVHSFLVRRLNDRLLRRYPESICS